MGAKLEEKVLRSIADYRRRSRRYLMSYVEGVAAEIINDLRQVEGVEAITPAGSFRRGKETVGDLDLLVTGPAAAAALDRFVAFPRVQELLAHGDNKASARVGLEGLQVDVRALPPESFGAAMQYFTGSKDHNVAIRTRAVRMGLKLSEYGLFRIEDDARVAGATEAGVYEALGMPWIPPELRENTGEIEAALEGRLPELIEGRHARRPPHAHHRDRRQSEPGGDGRGRPRAWLRVHRHHRPFQGAGDGERARRSPRGGPRATGPRPERVGRARHPRVQRHRVRHPPRRRDGPGGRRVGGARRGDRQLHSHLNLEPAEMTDRLLRALECPHLRILGHPTGRRAAGARVLAVRHRPRGRGGRPARRLARSERQPRAAGPLRPADSRREIERREVHHFDGRALAAEPRGHPLRHRDGAAGLAGTVGRDEHAAARRIRSGPTDKTMKLTESKKVYTCKLFTVTEDKAVDPKSKFEIKRSIVRHPGSAVMLAMDDKKRILMVRQYRLPAGKHLWELPAGKVDEGETPLQAAKRELTEETGYKAKTWRKLASFFASPGVRAGEDDGFSRHGSDCRGSDPDGGRADRDPLVPAQGAPGYDPVGADRGRENDNRIL